jgi:primosomal protein N' (replication factor Y)
VIGAGPTFAEVAVQAPVVGLYSYRVPDRLRDRDLVGSRAMVPFGGRGVTGVIVKLTDRPPEGVDRDKVRELDGLLDREPQLSPEMLALCMWIADYYEAPPGEVVRAALPAGTRVTAVQRIELTDDGRAALSGEGARMTRTAREILGALAAAGGTAPRKKLVRGKAASAELAQLIEDGLAAYALEMGKQRVKARTVRVARLARPFDDDARAALARAPARLAVLDALAAAGGEADVPALKQEQPRAAAHLRTLAKDGWVELAEREVRGVAAVGSSGMRAPARPPELNDLQKHALGAIEEAMDAGGFAPFLLHGITGSGKTEVYLHAIARALDAGKGAVVLVPEISLTPQLAARFRARFGDRVAVLHSGLGDRDRYDEWQRLRLGEARIALGARSAIFAPVADVGVVVVDEEHDSSFKQEEGVRYNARDVALVRAQRAGAVCLLGSATPSLESYYRAEAGHYRLLHLPERATPRPLPTVDLIDLRIYQPESEAMLTAPLAEAIEATLGRQEQVILFLNRRGFDTFVLCRSCGHAFRCDQCSVSLTYHRYVDRMVCHYCGFTQRVPPSCPECQRDDTIERKGLGTEKIADAVASRFPDARVARLDRDVATGAKVETILARVGRREVDILVGTQMVTKGHDFPAVTLVGVLCADTGLSLPDFRAGERTFQLLTQVAGRAGRGDRAGRVLIQSYRTEASPIASAAEQSYERFYRAELAARQELGYPPFGHLVALRLDSTDATLVGRAARELADRARQLADAWSVPVSVLGPSEAPLARIKGRSRWHVWLRAPERKPLRQVVRALDTAGERWTSGKVRLAADVDPISAL